MRSLIVLKKYERPKLLDPVKYYRLPWSLTDNGISWLEVTTRCNLQCKGCYRDPRKEGHKSLAEIADDLRVFKENRISDCMSIAGGDPLVHPDIVKIVKMIEQGGWKPILNTNGLALTKELLIELKNAGLKGITFHIDTTQSRMDQKDAKRESDYNKLRMKFAEMVASVGDIACSFNQTVSDKTLAQVPDTIEWAKKYPDIVHSVVFILYREPSMARHLNFYANGNEIKMEDHYHDETGFYDNKVILKAQDVVNHIRLADKLYDPAGYLNGTVDPKSFKWTLAIRYAIGNKSLAYAGKNFMKGVQHISHFIRGKWLSYSSPKLLSKGKLAMLAFLLFDQGSRLAMMRYLIEIVKNPLMLFKKVHIQAFAIIQAVDFLEDGQMNMCDGCPDMTVYKGKLYWSCRLEEIKEHGTWVTAASKQACAAAKS